MIDHLVQRPELHYQQKWLDHKELNKNKIVSNWILALGTESIQKIFNRRRSLLVARQGRYPYILHDREQFFKRNSKVIYNQNRVNCRNRDKVSRNTSDRRYYDQRSVYCNYARRNKSQRTVHRNNHARWSPWGGTEPWNKILGPTDFHQTEQCSRGNHKEWTSTFWEGQKKRTIHPTQDTDPIGLNRKDLGHLGGLLSERQN